MHPPHVPVAVPMYGWTGPSPTLAMKSNPLPNAPPIPTSSIESYFMKSRDLGFVIHAILKPVLLLQQEVSSIQEYDIQYWNIQRRKQLQKQQKGQSNEEAKLEEYESRTLRTEEWSQEKATLGYIAKTNITRPRALIKTSSSMNENDGGKEAKEGRTELWKARIYCDQANQAWIQVLSFCREQGPSVQQLQQQPFFMMWMKCLGLSSPSTLDSTAFLRLCYLRKGRNLVAQILSKHNLLPPSIGILLQNLLLPSCMAVACDHEDEEPLFRGIEFIVQSCHQMTVLIALLKNAQLKKQPPSMPFVECMQALLYRGKGVLTANPSMQSQWEEAEQEMTKQLTGTNKD